MTIDITKIRPGDRVTLVPLRVNIIEMGGRQGVQVVLRENPTSAYWATLDQIVAHHPAPREFQVGDRVRLGGGKYGTIRAIDEGDAWVRWDESGRNQGILIEALTLVEDGK